MSIFDTDSGADTNPDIVSLLDTATERKLLLQQQALQASRRAGLYAQPGLIQTPGFTSAVTGAGFVGPSQKQPLLADLVPLLADTGDQMDTQRLADAQKGQRALAAQFIATRPADDAPVADHIAWAQRGMQIPSLAPSMKSYLDYQLTKAPEERRKANQADVEMFLKGDQQFETARHNRAEEGQEPLSFQTDNYGNVTAYGSKSGRQYAITPLSAQGGTGPASTDDNDVPAPVAPSGTTSTDTNNVPGPPQRGGPGTGPNPIPTTGAGKPSGAVEKQISEGQTKQASAIATIQKLQAAKPLLENTVSGVKGALGEAGRNLGVPGMGPTTEADDNAAALDALGQWVASNFPRGPGSISDSERAMFLKATGDVGNRYKDPDVRSAAADTIMRLVAKDAGLPDPTDPDLQSNAARADTLRDQITKHAARLSQERGGPPTGNFTGDPTSAINAINDPVERAMARQAWAEQQKRQAQQSAQPTQAPTPSRTTRGTVKWSDLK